MTYTLSWTIPHRLITLDVNGILATEDATEIIQAYMKMLDANGQAPVHMIINALEVSNIDIKVRDLPNLLVGGQNDDRFGWTYIVTENRYVGFLTNMASHVTTSRFKATETVEAALQAIARIDTTISIPTDIPSQSR